MSYLRREKGGKGRKIAILILKKLTFAGFREHRRCTIIWWRGHNVTSAMRPVLRIKNHPILTNWVAVN